MKDLEKCSCGKIATWFYMPGKSDSDSQKCDECVPRGCGCNEYHVEEFDIPTDGDWKWTNEEKTIWTPLDGTRPLPCCEWSFDEEGLEID